MEIVLALIQLNKQVNELPEGLSQRSVGIASTRLPPLELCNGLFGFVIKLGFCTLHLPGLIEVLSSSKR
jgi:hypothetical protein